MLRIVATALLSLLLLPGHSLRAAEPEGVMNFFCSGTAEANDTRRPVKKIGLIINIDERTVIVSGLSVVAHIDRVDDVNILFGMESTAPVTSASSAASIALPAMRGISRSRKVKTKSSNEVRCSNLFARAHSDDGIDSRRTSPGSPRWCGGHMGDRPGASPPTSPSCRSG